jgi:hypothetical protein
MGAFFESALLFSLAVLIVLVGLLIYYFKGRIGELEQKNMKCLELVGEVYKSHLAFKQEVYGRLSTPVSMPLSMPSTAPVSEFQDPRIRVEIQEQSDQSDVDESDDESDDSESDQSDVEEPQIKMINVDLSGSLDAEEIEIDDAEEIDLGTEDLDNDEIEIGEVENITVNKMDQIDNEINIVDTDSGKSTQDDRESYKKMGLPALRSFIISKGYQTDSAKLQKMKKNELIDLIMESA